MFLPGLTSARGRSAQSADDDVRSLAGSVDRMIHPPRDVRIAGHGSNHKLRLGPDHPVCRAVGARFAQFHASKLVGMRHGERVEMGRCVHEGRECVFDFWFPHIGMAIDAEPRTDGEIQAKWVWALARDLIYVPPDQLNLEVVAELARTRRGSTDEVP